MKKTTWAYESIKRKQMEKQRNEQYLKEERRKLQNSLRNKTKEDEGRDWGGENGLGFFWRRLLFVHRDENGDEAGNPNYHDEMKKEKKKVSREADEKKTVSSILSFSHCWILCRKF